MDTASLWAHPQFASTLANGLAVLGCFSTGVSTLGNKDIAAQLSMSKPTVSRLSFTLMGLGYLRRDRQTGKYSLGPAVLSLGYPMLSQLTIRHLAGPGMLELARNAHGPVSMGVRDRLQVVYVETVQGQESSDTKPDIGSTRPFLRTAIGRALLFAHDEKDRASITKRLQKTYPDEWEKFSPSLDIAFNEIDVNGFCAVSGDWRPTLAAVAVPLRGLVHGMPLAFNLTVPRNSTNSEHLQKELGPALVELVRTIEQKLGMYGS